MCVFLWVSCVEKGEYSTVQQLYGACVPIVVLHTAIMRVVEAYTKVFYTPYGQLQML